MNVFDCLEERGLLDALTDPTLRSSDKPLNLYLGFDPTADSLHIGNLVGIVVLRWFQKFGHTPYVILGGATGRIGDPSGKSTERPLLDTPTIVNNVRRIKKHFEQILDFFHSTARPVVLNNDTWLSTITLIDFLRDVGKHFRVNVMITKEMVKNRLDSEEGISFTEFTYQLLQAYDFYHLFHHHKVTLQLGGSDQWGNITAGIDLIRKLTGKPSYGMTFPLLTRSDGRKFGKTEEGAIWLAADRCSPYQFYQYLYRMPDADVIKLMRMLTFMPMEEVRKWEKAMKEGGYVPNSAQKRLAEELTRLVHDEEGLKSALEATELAAPGHSATLDPATLEKTYQEMPHAVLTKGEVVGAKYVEVAVKAGLVSSKGEGTRLIEQGGAYLNNEKVGDTQLRLEESQLVGGKFLLLSAGKKKRIIIKVN